MSDLENLFQQLFSCPASDRVIIAERSGVSVSLIQDFISGHFYPDEELAAKISSVFPGAAE